MVPPAPGPTPAPLLFWPMQDPPSHPHTQKNLSFMINGLFGCPSPALLPGRHSHIWEPFLLDFEPPASLSLSRTHPGMQAPLSSPLLSLTAGLCCHMTNVQLTSRLLVYCTVIFFFLKKEQTGKLPTYSFVPESNRCFICSCNKYVNKFFYTKFDWIIYSISSPKHTTSYKQRRQGSMEPFS